MAAAVAPATPQRPLPGGFITTPAPQPPTIFAPNAAALRQNTAQPAADSAAAALPPTHTITPVERAAKTVNDTLTQEARFPELASYVTGGASGEYEMPKHLSWMPFQKYKDYNIPQRLLEQVDHTGIETHMGIFPPLGHAWLALDSYLYLWDYTLPNPEIIGWEDNSNPISAVKLVLPKPGVFIKDIRHLIVVVTNQEMILLGVTAQLSPTGVRTVQLYTTKMSISVRGLGVDLIEYTHNGRIFFTGRSSDDIYEFRYQQDEGWFSSRTHRICHTRGGMTFVQDNAKAVTQFWSSAGSKKLITAMAVDNTRGLLFSLTNTNEIKVWLLRAELANSLTRSMIHLLQSASSSIPRTELLTGRNVSLIAISAISAKESNGLSLMATTNTGCRLYLSVTRGYGDPASIQYPPSNMQVVHTRFPPRDPNAGPSSRPAPTTFGHHAPNLDPNSRALHPLNQATRLPPGYFLASKGEGRGDDQIFCSAPDSARLKNPQDTTQPNQRFAEFGMWLSAPGQLYDVVSMSAASFGTNSGPQGFGNELALQFDQPSADIALVASDGIRVIRRRRVVDVFAAVMKYGSSDDEGREGDIKRFVRMYGRGETAATALAVACGQGREVSSDSRLTSVTDPEVLEGARKAFIEHGGKPEYNANALPDNSSSQIDSVRPSPRHEGIALYLSRLVRSIWGAVIIRENIVPGAGPTFASTVSIDKLRGIQRDLNSLLEFLNRNKSFIEGLSGPRGLNRASSRQEEVAMQGEHRALHSLLQLLSSIVEGISFALVLFDERIEDILAALTEESRSRVKKLTYEALFVSSPGRELAKELVKAIVNRNIANGSNVDTIAEALRRRCGSFCSADDVVIFKAQEQVKRASEAGSQSETGRALLNESQRLFQKVATSLNMEHLHWATERYVEMAFYAGAIELCLTVAGERDRAKRALGWLKDGTPEGDDRRTAFESRKQCYDLVFVVIRALDEHTGGVEAQASVNNGTMSVDSRRRNEAYSIINGSDDAVFQTCLYDQYVLTGQADRLLDIDTNHVVEYLKRGSQSDKGHADLLWRYYAHHNDFLQAASVQLDLARGFFDLSLEERIEYLSRARTNASTRQTALMDSRQNKQQLLREISDLLDVANIQDDIFQRMKAEPRLTGERRTEVLRVLNGPILPVDELFNQFADQAGYYDICIQIFQVADHRNPADIKATWQSLIDQTDDQSQALYGRQALPWEAVGEKVRALGRRLNVSDSMFPIQTLLPMLERYALLPMDRPPPPNWALDIFLDVEIPHETLLPALEQIYYGNEHPFQGSKRRVIAAQMVYLLQSWYAESERRGERVAMGNEENASLVLDCVAGLLRDGMLDNPTRSVAERLTAAVNAAVSGR